MIHSLRIKNFRNFSSKNIDFHPGINLIVWINGAGKTNILEALSLPAHSLVESDPLYLLQKGEEVFHISYQLQHGSCSFAFSQKENKKNYSKESKKCSKASLALWYPHIIAFHPLMMNLMYLSPSERRSFLDEILVSAFPEYKKLLSEYKKILTSRNKVLKNISEGLSDVKELSFWNQNFIETASRIYSYRSRIVEYFQNSIQELLPIFWNKVTTLSFYYISKIDIKQAQSELETYIKNNQHKEVLLRKTLRGPHLDDFEIMVDVSPLTHFASRGEVKSIILWLKFLSSSFLEKYSSKDIIYIIDDILSELDEIHIQQVWDYIGQKQCIVSSIQDHQLSAHKIFL